ncbi:MAG: hypothetical protein KatS3mg015_2402 [Fimbriimonadales bacterium]|nr:MAG: hypothetical protein KatS3mg015_2402 [Fimbriimonadales bacterium]
MEDYPDDLHPAYARTHFEVEGAPERWPERFAIITAYATTGQTWTPGANEEADRRLEAELRTRGLRPFRVTGYDPEAGHAEPGWGVALDHDAACELGRGFRQDAIYYVEGDRLLVSRCGQGTKRYALGSFRERVCARTAG